MSMSITHIQLYTTFHHSFSWYSWFHKYSLNIFHFIYFSSILFADIVGFTNLSSQCSAQVKISLFDNIFILVDPSFSSFVIFHKWESRERY